jgi:hypothetical protein
VGARAQGTRRIYALDQAGVDAARACLARLTDPLEPLTQPLDALGTELARGRRARRTGHPEQAPPLPGEQGSRPA